MNRSGRDDGVSLLLEHQHLPVGIILRLFETSQSVFGVADLLAKSSQLLHLASHGERNGEVLLTEHFEDLGVVVVVFGLDWDVLLDHHDLEVVGGLSAGVHSLERSAETVVVERGRVDLGVVHRAFYTLVDEVASQ